VTKTWTNIVEAIPNGSQKLVDTFRKVYNTHIPQKEIAEFELSLLNHSKGEPHRLDQVPFITSVNRLENISNTEKIIWYMPTSPSYM
jgi:hypothetical protein